jgi:hypothetical protein
MPEVSFKIGEAFPADDPVARFVTVVAMISNDWLRLFGEMTAVRGDDPEAHARLTLNYRLQAALHYEAADFLRTARSNFPEVGAFINALPPAARLEFDEIVGGIDPESKQYHGRWLKENRNQIFHYSELNQRKAVGKALIAAAEKSGSISYITDELGSVRFWFADEVAIEWLSDATQDEDRMEMLKEAVLATMRFAQRGMSVYLGQRGVR